MESIVLVLLLPERPPLLQTFRSSALKNHDKFFSLVRAAAGLPSDSPLSLALRREDAASLPLRTAAELTSLASGDEIEVVITPDAASAPPAPSFQVVSTARRSSVADSSSSRETVTNLKKKGVTITGNGHVAVEVESGGALRRLHLDETGDVELKSNLSNAIATALSSSYGLSILRVGQLEPQCLYAIVSPTWRSVGRLVVVVPPLDEQPGLFSSDLTLLVHVRLGSVLPLLDALRLEVGEKDVGLVLLSSRNGRPLDANVVWDALLSHCHGSSTVMWVSHGSGCELVDALLTDSTRGPLVRSKSAGWAMTSPSIAVGATSEEFKSAFLSSRCLAWRARPTPSRLQVVDEAIATPGVEVGHSVTQAETVTDFTCETGVVPTSTITLPVAIPRAALGSNSSSTSTLAAALAHAATPAVSAGEVARFAAYMLSTPTASAVDFISAPREERFKSWNMRPVQVEEEAPAVVVQVEQEGPGFKLAPSIPPRWQTVSRAACERARGLKSDMSRWSPMGVSDGVTTYSFKSSGSAGSHVGARGDTFIPAPLPAFLHTVVLDNSSRYALDPQLDALTLVEAVTPQVALEHMRMKGVMFTSPRDMATLSGWEVQEDGSLIVWATSVSDERIPPSSAYVRANVDIGAWIARPVSREEYVAATGASTLPQGVTECMALTYLFNIDIGGTIPTYITKTVVTQQASLPARVAALIAKKLPALAAKGLLDKPLCNTGEVQRAAPSAAGPATAVSDADAAAAPSAAAQETGESASSVSGGDKATASAAASPAATPAVASAVSSVRGRGVSGSARGGSSSNRSSMDTSASAAVDVDTSMSVAAFVTTASSSATSDVLVAAPTSTSVQASPAPTPARPAASVPRYHMHRVFNLTGTWCLNKGKSESMMPVLASMGVPWIARKMIENVEFTLIIDDKPELFTYGETSSLGKQSMSVPLTWEAADITGSDGKTMRLRAFAMAGVDEVTGDFDAAVAEYKAKDAAGSSERLEFPSHGHKSGCVVNEGVLPNDAGVMADIRHLVTPTELRVITIFTKGGVRMNRVVRYYNLVGTAAVPHAPPVATAASAAETSESPARTARSALSPLRTELGEEESGGGTPGGGSVTTTSGSGNKGLVKRASFIPSTPRTAPALAVSPLPSSPVMTLSTTTSSELPSSPWSGGRWIPDDAATGCTACASPFTLINRKHHCRACGRIFCDNCSRSRMPLAHMPADELIAQGIDPTGLVRVCDTCAKPLVFECSAARPTGGRVTVNGGNFGASRSIAVIIEDDVAFRTAPSVDKAHTQISFNAPPGVRPRRVIIDVAGRRSTFTLTYGTPAIASIGVCDTDGGIVLVTGRYLPRAAADLERVRFTLNDTTVPILRVLPVAPAAASSGASGVHASETVLVRIPAGAGGPDQNRFSVMYDGTCVSVYPFAYSPPRVFALRAVVEPLEVVVSPADLDTLEDVLYVCGTGFGSEDAPIAVDVCGVRCPRVSRTLPHAKLRVVLEKDAVSRNAAATWTAEMLHITVGGQAALHTAEGLREPEEEVEE